MSEYETDAPLDTPPTDFHHTTYESLDPPKETEPEIRGDKTGLDEAAAELSQTRAEKNEITERHWGDPRDWSKHAPGNRTVSAEHAADMLKQTREVEAALAQAEMGERLAAGVDEFRGQQPAQPQQPEAQPQAPEVQAEYVAEPDALDRLLSSVPDPKCPPAYQTRLNRRLLRQGSADRTGPPSRRRSRTSGTSSFRATHRGSHFCCGGVCRRGLSRTEYSARPTCGRA